MPSIATPGPVNLGTIWVKALALALRWRRVIESGRRVTIADLAAAATINPSYVSGVP